MRSKVIGRSTILGRVLAVGIALILAATACTSDGDGGSGEAGTDKLKVVTTVSPITSLAENIGGTRIDLEGIVPEGVNSHTFEPSPSLAAVLSEADLFLANGLFLEEPSIELARANLKDGGVIVTLADRAVSREEWIFDFSFPSEDGHPNPHLWTSPPLALRYAELIRDELAALDPDNAAYYDANLAALTESIDDLDKRITEAVATIPPENRKLLTYHDSFPYFGPRYGFEIIGAVQPSDFTEPSAREVAQLIEQIRESEVPAIFGSEVFPSTVMAQIAKEGGVEFVEQLRDDDLPGAPGGPRHTYMGLILTDVEIIVTALGGNIDALEGYDPGPVFEGDSGAHYPQ